MADLSSAPSETGMGPNPFTAAKSFTEPEVSVSHDTTITTGDGSVEIGSELGTTASRPEDGNSNTASDIRGLEVNPNADIEGVRVSVSANSSGYSTAYLYDGAGNQLDSATISNGVADLVASLTSGTNYYVGLGESATKGSVYSTSGPFTSTDIDITAGAYGISSGVSTTDTDYYSFSDVTAITNANPASGNPVFERVDGVPEDIYEWGVVTFTRTLDGETVDVYLAYSTDGGATWTRTNGGDPISRRYDVGADGNVTPEMPVRFEVELSRQDTSNNPSIDSVIWSWRL